MLAQNFKTAAELGISEVELDALIKVLGMLERGELVHGKYPLAKSLRGPNEFNMAATLSTGEACGTVACLCGWAYVVSNKAAFANFIEATCETETDAVTAMPRELRSLFGFGRGWGTLNPRTPAQAALALRSYLTTGEANWAEALAAR